MALRCVDHDCEKTCREDEPHRFHSRLDAQQSREGRSEPCVLCGKAYEDKIHKTR